jgi:ABC-type nitrate/sulfonate/bicarbonate transport system substrate-binding protein
MKRMLVRFGVAFGLAAALTTFAFATPLRIGIGFGVGFLPTFILGQQKLIEKHAKAAGLDIEPTYQRFSGSGAMQDAILSGSVDLGVYGVPALLIAWDKAKGTANQIFGICGVNSSPLVLVTNKPDAKSLKDLGPGDKISMPAIVSPQMYVLQILSEKTFGEGQKDKLKTQVVALPHPESIGAILSGISEVKAYFSTPPFTQIALDSGKAHKLASSEDAFGGRSSFLVLGGTKKWIDANPKLIPVLVAAFQEAADYIRKDPKGAAEIYLKVEPSKMLDEAKVEAMLKSMPDDFGTEVHAVKAYADFMGRTGGLKNVPASWSDVFPAINDTKSH